MTPESAGRSPRRTGASRLACLAALLWAVVALPGCPPTTPPPPPPPNPNLLCFPQVIGVPHFAGPPTIDGRLSGLTPSPEFGWTGSLRYTFGNGSVIPDAIVQGIRDGSDVYLSFEVNFASTPDIKDGILAVFRPTKNDPTNDRRVFIAPFQQNVSPPANTPISPQSVQYWVDSSNDAWNDPNQAAGQPATNLAFLFNNIQVQRETTNTWRLEWKIPIVNTPTNGIANKSSDTGVNFPASGDFGLYFDILDHTAMGYVEHAFPMGVGLTSGGILAPGTNTPSAGTWGRGSLGGMQCNGVSFDWYDIAIQHPQSVQPVSAGTISLNQANRFTVTPHNASVDANGNYIPALDVDATFRIADFGIAGPGDYAPVPVPTPPATPGLTNVNATVPVPPNNTTQGTVLIALSPDWTLDSTQQSEFAANTHQCVLAELNSNATNPPTILLNKSVVRNMDFAQTMSPYRRSVSVRAGRERREDSDVILVARTFNTPLDAKWSVELQGAEPISGAGPGVYALRVKAGQRAEVGTETDPPPVKIPKQDLRLPPDAGADGRGVPIHVNPGDLITLIVDGSVQVRRDKPAWADANGAPLDPRAEGGAYLLPSGLAPGSRVGAVVGAWNGDFKEEAVVVGSATTLKVPTGAETLVLAINDTPKGFKEHGGNGFHVQVIETPLEPYFAMADSSILRDPSAEKLKIPLGANLPTMVVCGYRKTGRKISVNGFVDELLEQLTCFGYQFNSIGRP